MPPTFDELMDSAKLARIAELESLITKARDNYYNSHSQPTVSDDVFDAWKDELASLKADSPAVTAIGAPPPIVSEWKKVQHTILMGSLDKVNTIDELTAWAKGCSAERLLVTEKLDGMSIHVRYEAGSFVQAATRGDGHTGEDISVNVGKMKGVSAKLPLKFTGSLRGEIILTKRDHATHFPDYENTRNAAAGIAKRYDGRGCELLSVIFYQVSEGKDFRTEGQQFEWLQEMGFKVPNWYVTTMGPGVKTPHDLWVEYQQTKRDALDYEIDGLVVRLDDLEKQIALGEKDGRPLGAVAYKFAAITRETTLRQIQLQTGGMGVITPVAIFDPVRLVGATVTNASLYNWKYIRELGVDVGAKVLVARANDVIPRVVRVTVGTGSVFAVPNACPSCGTKPEFEGEHLVCPNASGCPSQAVGRIKRYVKALDIKEWGDVLIEKLVELGLVHNIGDLYRLQEDQLAELERMGERSAQKVRKTLWEKTPLPLEELLGALSIPLCATSTIKLAMDAGFDTLDSLRVATSAQLAAITGFGPVKAEALATWFRTSGSVVDDILGAGVQIKPRVKGLLTGKSFCFTGASNLPRTELEDLVRQAGGEVKTSVTKKLMYLVMADPQSNSTKAQAARRNGTCCISEEDLLKMAGQ